MMNRRLLCVALMLVAPSGFSAGVRFVGVNLAGAEFGDSNLPGTYNQHYTYPTTVEVDYFLSKGMNLIRLPFRWERLQPIANGPFDGVELGRIQALVNHVASRGGYVLLDPHN